MASAPFEPITGTVDADGRLVSADPPLERLQREAGSGLGRPLAVPQLALVVRLARKLGVTISRPALAASENADLDLWVRAEPQDGQVRLAIESWSERPVQRQRWPDKPMALEKATGGSRFEVDAELRLVALDPELGQELGTMPGDAVGQPLTRLVRLEANESGDMPLLQAVAARQNFAAQRAVPRGGGAALMLSGEVRVGAGGEFAGFAGLAVPELADARSVVQAPELDELLRLPLDRIASEAQQIAERTEGPLRSDYAAYASDIMTASRHLLDVLESMSVTTQAVAVGGASEGRIDLVALALEAAGLVQSEAAEAGLMLEVEGETALPAQGEARSVTQILVNLLGNAIRHSPRGGTVRITALRGAAAEVTIADQGPGIGFADRERIFEPFEQVVPGGGGRAGLGLAIARRLARSMGGDILLDSTPGQGARFTLRLPPG